MLALPSNLKLAPGERPLFVRNPPRPMVFAQLAFTFGLYEIWRRRTFFILTTERVVLAKGLISRSVKSIPIAKVQDIDVETVLWSGRVRLSSAGAPGLGLIALSPMWMEDAQLFADGLQRVQGGAVPAFEDGSQIPIPFLLWVWIGLVSLVWLLILVSFIPAVS